MRINAMRQIAVLVLLATLGAAVWPAVSERGVARGAFPGENGLIAFSDGAIVTINPDGSNRRDLTTGAYDFYPAFSPDGTQIAFSRYVETPTESITIWVMNADGSDARRVTDPSMSSMHPAWSPTGTELVFSANVVGAEGPWAGPWDLHVMDADGGAPTRLTTTPSDATHAGWVMPAWAPDGHHIAAVNRADGGLYVIEDDGSSPVRLADASADPAWSPDGDWLIYVNPQDGLSRIRGNGSDRAVVTTTTAGWDKRPAWSPDGTKIVYETMRSGEEPNLIALAMINADGSGFVRMTETTNWAREPSWGIAVAPPTPSPTPTPTPSPGPDPDADGDGVDDRIDAGDGRFDDGSGTTGAILDAAGLQVWAEPHPDGVRISVGGSGPSRATIEVCGFAMRLAAGSDVVVSCGSITVTVISGAAEIQLGGGIVVVTMPAGVVATLTELPDGTYTIRHDAGTAPISVVVDGITGTVEPGSTVELQAWDFIGFSAPVDNPDVLNIVKAGSSVPLKWYLSDGAGQPVLDLGAASVRVESIPCNAGSSTDHLEEVAAGSSSLQNLGGGAYQLNWKTPKSYANSCKAVRLDIGDGVVHTALFMFKR